MQDYPLTISSILKRAVQVYPESELVSTTTTGVHRYTYREFYQRVVRAMNMLRALGVKPGDRVATFAWNSNRHMELYYAIPCMGAVLHTLNIRLFPEQLTYIVNHAEDTMIFVDSTLTAPLEALSDQFKTVKKYIIMSDSGPVESKLSPTYDYETLLSQADDTEDFPVLDENTASSLCYTSGTTGNPKGALYSHRSNYLHALMENLAVSIGFTDLDVVMPVVPMFHANAWGAPYACPMVGSKMVFPGHAMTPDNLCNLIENEQVTFALGVPTIWTGMLQHLRETKGNLKSVRGMIVGGSAVPRSMIEAYKKEFDVQIYQAWGMTELSPLGTIARLSRKMQDWSEDKQFDLWAKAGQPAPGVEIRIINDNNEDQPWDGKSPGELLIRGPAVVKSYYKNEEASEAFTDDGWFRTGDVATMDEDGVLVIADRTKDLIKSGGEWISSVEMEGAIMNMAEVLEAAVVARPDPKWDERPVAFVVKGPTGGDITSEGVLEYLKDKFATWQLPSLEDIRFTDALPKTSVGKFDKKVLRTQL